MAGVKTKNKKIDFKKEDNKYISQPIQNSVPLYSRDYEMAVLSTVFLDNKFFEDLRLILNSNDFYIKQHQIIWKRIEELYEKKIEFDGIYFLEYIKNDMENMLIEYKTITNILSNQIPNLSFFSIAKAIKNYSKLRELYSYGYNVQMKCEEPNVQADLIVSEMENDIYQISRNNSIVNEIEKINVKEIIESILGGNEEAGTLTGYPSFDSLTGGLHKGNLYYLAGRPSQGKTALALNIMRNIRNKYKTDDCNVGLFTLEQPKKDIMKRFMSMEAKIDLMHLTGNSLSKKDLKNLSETKKEIEKKFNELYIIDNLRGLNDIIYKGKKLIRDKNCSGLIVDYIQLMDNLKEVRSREAEISSISRRLKQFVMEENCWVLALSQMNREIEHRGKTRRPQLSDLRESGALEQDGDIISFMFRPDPENEPRVGSWMILKHRNGPIGVIPIDFMVDFQIIKEI